MLLDALLVAIVLEVLQHASNIARDHGDRGSGADQVDENEQRAEHLLGVQIARCSVRFRKGSRAVCFDILPPCSGKRGERGKEHEKHLALGNLGDQVVLALDKRSERREYYGRGEAQDEANHNLRGTLGEAPGEHAGDAQLAQALGDLEVHAARRVTREQKVEMLNLRIFVAVYGRVALSAPFVVRDVDAILGPRHLLDEVHLRDR